LIPLLSKPTRVGEPNFLYIRNRRDNDLESTRGSYTTIEGGVASSYFGSEADFSRLLIKNSTYHTFFRNRSTGTGFVFARSTSVGVENPFGNTVLLDPSQPVVTGEALIPLPERFYSGGGNSHRGFGLNQAGPRDPGSGFPLGGTAVFVNSIELRMPPVALPYLGEGFGFAIFHDMGNVFTAPHDAAKGFLRWHQANPALCLPSSTTNTPCITEFNNSGYDYTSHAVGLGLRYKTPIGPLRFDFGYNLNPTRYFQESTITGQPTTVEAQRLRHFNVFFSIGQPF
jgi:outer membrane protein assembly factor BamA